MEHKKLKKFNKIFPWYAGISTDLLFWAAIDTLFLTIVKNLSASEIVSITSISLVISILVQIPLLKIINRIGNTNSVKVGTFIMLVASLLLTFGNNYFVIAVGKTIYQISFVFLNMINVVLKNNLSIQGKEEEYIKYRTKANTIYAVLTMIIAFIASTIFNINNYLPMIVSIIFCVIALICRKYKHI